MAYPDSRGQNRVAHAMRALGGPTNHWPSPTSTKPHGFRHRTPPSGIARAALASGGKRRGERLSAVIRPERDLFVSLRPYYFAAVLWCSARLNGLHTPTFTFRYRPTPQLPCGIGRKQMSKPRHRTQRLALFGCGPTAGSNNSVCVASRKHHPSGSISPERRQA